MAAAGSDGLEGRTAVVTGGASGIGRACADRLAAAGARVFVADLNPPQGAGEFVRTDVTDEDSIQNLADHVLARAGAPEVLVNAAGWDRTLPFAETSFEFIDQIVRLNLLGCLKVTRALLPSVLAAARGKIVNVASDAGRVGSSGETAYAGAKGGVIAFTKSLAVELAADNITVNCVCPGATDTPMSRIGFTPDQFKKREEIPPLMDGLTHKFEIVGLVRYLLSDATKFVTGQTFFLRTPK
jgi:2-hydroxycyclohexanecarboxyl-CoA dehydrogenase